MTEQHRADSWVLELPAVKPMTLNERPHWAVRARMTKALREGAYWMARAARIPPQVRISVELHFIPPTERRRDPDNYVATLKPVIDGLVDAGVVPDDTRQYVERHMPVIDPKGPPRPRGNRLYLVVKSLGDT